MGVHDGEGGRQVYGEVRVEADGVDVEQRDERSVCVCLELSEELGSYGCGCEDEGVRAKGVGLVEERVYRLACVSYTLICWCK